MPPASALGALRRDIDRKPHKIKRVLTDAGIRSVMFGGIPDDEGKAVKAFVNQHSNKSSALKKHPKVSGAASPLHNTVCMYISISKLACYAFLERGAGGASRLTADAGWQVETGLASQSTAVRDKARKDACPSAKVRRREIAPRKAVVVKRLQDRKVSPVGEGCATRV